MDRLIRLSQLWSWLPAFRAVAETEHVHQAAARLHLTPSTLSRAIRLLEEDLGHALFRRVGRSLELTDAGHELLRGLREAMRRLDDAVVAVTRQETAPLRVAAEEAVALAVVLDALDAYGTAELATANEDTVQQLLRGSIDVAFVTTARPATDLVVTLVGELWFSAYGSCSAADTARGYIDAPGLPWPPERPRAVVVRVASAALALAACRAGAGAAMLPEVAAGELVRLVDDCGEPLVRVRRPVYAVCRRPLHAGGAAAALTAAVRARLAQPVRDSAMEPSPSGRSSSEEVLMRKVLAVVSGAAMPLVAHAHGRVYTESNAAAGNEVLVFQAHPTARSRSRRASPPAAAAATAGSARKARSRSPTAAVGSMPSTPAPTTSACSRSRAMA